MDTTRNEMNTFTALLMLMARTRHNSLKGHWLKAVLLNSKLFLASTARHRTFPLSECSIFRIMEIKQKETNFIECMAFSNKFLKVFHYSFTPFQEFCIYESLALFKERLNFKHYIKTKRHRY
jgi:hypothetical protein